MSQNIGIFGGSFNPLHNGHIEVVKAALKLKIFDKVLVIPSNQNPLKTPVEGPSAETKLEMLRKGFELLGEKVEVDGREILRGGTSYTVETVSELKKKYKKANLTLILGIDVFYELPKWKDYQDILEITDFLVTTRPLKVGGHSLPKGLKDLPAEVKKFFKTIRGKKGTLTSGKKVTFVEITDVEVSATLLRKKMRKGEDIAMETPAVVADFIKKNRLYSATPKVTDFIEFTQYCAQGLFDGKALNLKAIELLGKSSVSDYVIVCSGTSTRHTSSLAENLIQKVKKERSLLPLSVEGLTEGRWVLVDYGNVVIHIFYDYVRQEYRLEDLWARGRDLNIKEETGKRD